MEGIEAILTAEEHLAVAVLMVGVPPVAIALEPISGIIVPKGFGPRIESGKASPRAQPQTPRLILQDADDRIMRQAITDPILGKGLGISVKAV
jgi:hypothetical protein